MPYGRYSARSHAKDLAARRKRGASWKLGCEDRHYENLVIELSSNPLLSDGILIQRRLLRRPVTRCSIVRTSGLRAADARRGGFFTVIMVGMLATYGYEQRALGESCETQTSQFPIFKMRLILNICHYLTHP
jgi:hypothetical protein